MFGDIISTLVVGGMLLVDGWKQAGNKTYDEYENERKWKAEKERLRMIKRYAWEKKYTTDIICEDGRICNFALQHKLYELAFKYGRTIDLEETMYCLAIREKYPLPEQIVEIDGKSVKVFIHDDVTGGLEVTKGKSVYGCKVDGEYINLQKRYKMLDGKKNKVVYKLSFDRKEAAGEIHYTFHKQEIPFNLKDCDNIAGTDYFFEIVRDENKHCEDDPKLLFCILNNSDAQDIAEKSLMYMGYDVSDFFKRLFEVYHEDEIVKVWVEKLRTKSEHRCTLDDVNHIMLLKLKDLFDDVIIDNKLHNYYIQISLYKLGKEGLSINNRYAEMHYQGQYDFINKYEKDRRMIIHRNNLQKRGITKNGKTSYVHLFNISDSYEMVVRNKKFCDTNYKRECHVFSNYNKVKIDFNNYPYFINKEYFVKKSSVLNYKEQCENNVISNVNKFGYDVPLKDLLQRCYTSLR